MLVRQTRLISIESDNDSGLAQLREIEPHLLFVFGRNSHFQHPDLGSRLRVAFPTAELAGCSTKRAVSDQGQEATALVLTAIRFERSGVHVVSTLPADSTDSFETGQRLGNVLRPRGVHAALVLGGGHTLQRESFSEGLSKSMPGTRIAGGFFDDAGEGLTLHNLSTTAEQIVVIGFTGRRLRFETVEAANCGKIKQTGLWFLTLGGAEKVHQQSTAELEALLSVRDDATQSCAGYAASAHASRQAPPAGLSLHFMTEA